MFLIVLLLLPFLNKALSHSRLCVIVFIPQIQASRTPLTCGKITNARIQAAYCFNIENKRATTYTFTKSDINFAPLVEWVQKISLDVNTMGGGRRRMAREGPGKMGSWSSQKCHNKFQRLPMHGWLNVLLNCPDLWGHLADFICHC